VKKLIIVLVVIFAALILFLLAGPFYVVNEGETAVVTRFGKIVSVKTEAGLKFKSPFVDKIVVYSKKVLPWDGESRQIQTQENQLIWVDTTARWRISDPAKFYSAVSTMDSAYGKLDDVIDNAVRTVVSQHRLSEAVRSSNKIQESKATELFQTGDETSDEALRRLTQSDAIFESIVKGRKKMSQDMLTIAQSIVPEYGIEILDVVIREIAYTDDQIQNIYDRMTKDRSQVAQAYRSFGEGKKAEWMGKMEKEQKSIMSEAVKKAEIVKGEADAKATRVYADSYSRDPEFFAFWRAMESYKLTMPNFAKTMSTDMDYFRFLYKSKGK
jgi:membrane protease subunit HflC